MTSITLINIYLEGFRAAHYDKLPNSACPYVAEQAEHWQKGHQYGQNLNKILTSFYKKNNVTFQS